MIDKYTCQDCKITFQKYHRFCPYCGGEKTIEFVAYGRLDDFITNLFSITSDENLKTCADCSGLDFDRGLLLTSIRAAMGIE